VTSQQFRETRGRHISLRGFGPKDLQDLSWDDIDGDRVTLPRSKTGVSQTVLLWPETQTALGELRRSRADCIARLKKRGRERADGGHVFVTKYWRPWNKDVVAEEFRKLCETTALGDRRWVGGDSGFGGLFGGDCLALATVVGSM